MSDSYDYIVVGGGSAGCILAARLSEDPGRSVLLVEAGVSDTTPELRRAIETPRYFQFMQKSVADWDYETEPQGNLNGRRLYTPRGRILGGTSTFVAGLAVRGSPSDYDHWARVAGDSRWKFENILRFFHRLEGNTRHAIPEHHGRDGPMTVSDIPIHPATEAFLRASKELGFGCKDDLSDLDSQCGAGTYQVFEKDSVRVNTAGAYLTSEVRRRPNLRIEISSEVTRLLIDSQKRAYGIEYTSSSAQGQNTTTARAECEVLVACGTINSPKLLMLSGLGPAGHLRQNGIRVIQDMPGVGQNLHDHPIVGVLYSYRPGAQPPPSREAGIEGGLFLNTRGAPVDPNLQFVFCAGAVGPPQTEPDWSKFALITALMRSVSRGRIRLARGAPEGKPKIEAQILADRSEVKTMVKAIRISRRIIRSSAFDEVRGEELAPGPSVKTDAQIEAYVRATAGTLFHPVGTCAMGIDSQAGAVVDSNLRVFGIRGLRVVDASIMPVITTGNTLTPTCMIAEMAADLIRRQNGPGEAPSKPPPSVTTSPPEPAFPFPLALPPGVNPETYKIEEVTALLNQAAYFSLFSLPNPNQANQATPARLPFPLSLVKLVPFVSDLLLASVSVHEASRRFSVRMIDRGKDGLAAINRMGEEMATVHIEWHPIPWNYAATSAQAPPQTILNITESQRFEMLGGQFSFNDARHSGFKGFGAGRTFPCFPRGLSLRIGAVIDILEGFGDLQGCKGTVVVNGKISPPRQLALNLMVRVVDPDGRFQSPEPLPPLQEVSAADATATFLVFKGEVDSTRPVQLRMAPDGAILGSSVYERLRLLDTDFAFDGSGHLKSVANEGRIVGEVLANLHFNPLDKRSVIPIQTTEGLFRFWDEAGRELGTISSDMVEGRAFPTPLPGMPLPAFRFGGFGPISEGTGIFAQATGMMSMNSIISVFPRTLSNLYIFRLDDSVGRFAPLRADSRG